MPKINASRDDEKKTEQRPSELPIPVFPVAGHIRRFHEFWDQKVVLLHTAGNRYEAVRNLTTDSGLCQEGVVFRRMSGALQEN